uniref:Lactamase_B domain-containing protein n=1 Tax=Brugia timori TaxID=42155 RepID=A0A0R3RDL9_9BILA
LDISFEFLFLGGVDRTEMNASELRLTLVSVLQMKLCQLLIADVSFIAQEKKDLLGIIITHAHEDHCDAVPYL